MKNLIRSDYGGEKMGAGTKEREKKKIEKTQIYPCLAFVEPFLIVVELNFG